MYKAEILLDSQAPNGCRLTTMRITLPRFVLAELNTHRKLSKNAGSSRAISVKRRIAMVEQDPVFPLEWGLNQKGMQASELLDQESVIDANCVWKDAANYAAECARQLDRLGVHKQLVNRILEPFVWVDVIVSSTEWDNLFMLRCSPKAQPEIRKIAEMMRDRLAKSIPKLLQWNEWHIPLADERGVAVGRLARVSYEAGSKTDEEERQLCQQLALDGHWSPFEHVAQARYDDPRATSRNFDPGWVQWRAMIDG